jgi:hypothetical protein
MPASILLKEEDEKTVTVKQQKLTHKNTNIKT